jgi:hypothetical protein
MAEIKEFVINDRRRFTSDGEVRPDAPPPQPAAPRPEAVEPTSPPPDQYNSSASHAVPSSGPHLVTEAAREGADVESLEVASTEETYPPPPTEEQNAQAIRAYEATVDRLDTVIRAQNPGMEQIPPMSFERLVQSVYMQAIMQLGGAAQPGTTPQVDLLGARQSIDMLTIIFDKTRGNLSESESRLIDAALFEMRMGFLEVTQALARQASAQQPSPAPAPSGPSIVR